jgi:glc operon protein GlcG
MGYNCGTAPWNATPKSASAGITGLSASRKLIMAGIAWLVLHFAPPSGMAQIMYVADSKRLTHEGAKRMVATAIGAAREAGIAIAVAITDAGGHLIVLERMDGGRFHTVHSATTKAVCAASNKRPTSPHGAQAQPLDVAHALGLALAAGPERWTAMEGGFPIMVDGECIGGIGVSGGDWETDERIARAAVEAIGAGWKL